MSSNPINVKPEMINGHSSNSITIASLPDECPICHYKINPIYRISAFLNDNGKLEVIFQCTREKCQHLFISFYEKNRNNDNYYWINSSPCTPERIEYSKEIQDVSPTFCEIVNQVNFAEANQLTLITGIGLRKAIEYLVKDFIIYQHPNKSDFVKQQFLGKCIEEYIDDVNIKNCIKRATWLANDETHYIKKWEYHDINDLKILIKLSTNWIENNLLTEKYMDEMKE